MILEQPAITQMPASDLSATCQAVTTIVPCIEAWMEQ
jgi:hypothetical protein